MITRIQKYIQLHNLCNSGTPILVACSGGVDSMVLADVLLKLNYTIAIAHCNFQLRGEASDADEKFVEDFAKKNKLPFHFIKFDTKKFKKDNDLSTQMAARELRYDWFEKIRKEKGYHVIAAAHHLDDQLETVLLNFTKGTGIKGLTGMQPKNGFIVRPLLEISKKEILEYAVENDIAFREDESNASDDYQRNAIRHQIIPQLQKINPALYESAKNFIRRMYHYDALSEERIASLKKKCWSEKNGIVEIKTGFIRAHAAGQTILFHLLKDFGFNSDQVAQIYQGFSNSGSQFFSDTHRAVMDRNSLFVVAKNTEREDRLVFDKIPNQILYNNYKIECKIISAKEVNMKDASRFAYFDLKKIEFPIMVRYYKEGDYFYPFGLSKPKTPGRVGKKKLSKYFKDEKFSLLEKENTPVLFAGEKILWLAGHRIDDRFKVTDKTISVLKMTIVDEEKS